MLNSRNLFYGLLVFLAVLVVNLAIRWGAISSEIMIADDLIYLPLALAEQCIIPARHPIDFNFICHEDA